MNDKNLSIKDAKKQGIRPSIIIVPTVIFALCIIFGTINGEAFISVLNNIFLSLMINGGWLIAAGTLAFVVFMIFIFVHPIGNIKLGGKDAKPEYSLWNWFAISLCAGIGTGIVFWGPVEPLKFAVTPQMATGIDPNTREAVIWSLSKSYLHWGFAPYACYAVFGVIIAFAFYNLKKDFNVSSGFAPLLKEKAEKTWFKGLVDTLTSFAIIGGVAGSLGCGLLQIASGLNTVFGIEQSNLVYIVICVVIVIIYNVSSITGMNRGIRWLSDKNAWIFLILLVLAFVFGPMSWTCNLFVESFGSHISTFVESITQLAPFGDTGEVLGRTWHQSSELWSQWWDQYYFVDFLSFGPIVGLFSIKLAKGRTLREFVVMNWFVPAMFGIIWFAIFGGLVLDIQYNFAQYANVIDLQGCATLFDYMLKFGNEAMMLKVIEVIPFSTILKPVILALIVLSFVTLADSTTSTVSLLAIKNNKDIEEAPAALKLLFGILMGGSSLIFTLTGNIEGIKIIKTIAGFPILIMGIAMMVMFLIYISKKENKKEMEKMMDED